MASTTYEQKRFCEIKRCGKIDLFGNVPVMVRNAGQLPQPFWLGAACGGGSCSAARCAARTWPTEDDRRHQKRTAWEGRP